MNYDRKQLKRTAKALVHDTQPKVWVTTLFYVLLTTVAVQIITAVVPNPWVNLGTAIQMYPDYLAENPELLVSLLSAASGGMVLSLFVSVLTSLYQAVMNYGYRGYTLKVWRRETVAHTDLFSGFPMAGRVIGASILVEIFTFLWLMLMMLGLIMLVFAAAALMAAVELLGIVVLIVAYVLLLIGILFVIYRYCLTPYFIMSDPEMGIMEAITASKMAMRGNYRKRLVLDLSFLGWSLLVALIQLAVYAVGFTAVFWGNFAPLTYWIGQHGMSTSVLVEMAGIPGIVVLILVFVISLPLNLWVSSYIRVADAGFFETVKALPSTQSRLERHIAGADPYAYGGVPPIPPEPPVEEPEDTEAVNPQEPAPLEALAPEEPSAPEEPEMPQEPTDEGSN